MAALEGLDGAAVDWTALSKNAGVDFAALRTKYAGLATKNNGSAVAGTATPATIAEGGVAAAPSAKSSISEMDPDEIARTQAALDRLEKVHVCHMCHGSGIMRYMYNFQQREKNCDACDGEGLRRKGSSSGGGGGSNSSGGGGGSSEGSSNGNEEGSSEASTDNSSSGGGVVYELSSSEDSLFTPVPTTAKLGASESGHASDERGEEEDDEEEECDEPPPMVI